MEQSTVSVVEQGREAAKAAPEVGFAWNPKDLKLAEDTPLAAASSPEAEAFRQEIIRAGHKLWQRQYVDGNGGNISVRLSSQYVLCTPTMVSKEDLVPADICLSDLDGNILAGDRSRTSELLLHLAIYKANPRARAVVHCHPPYATAFAVTGATPPNGLITEYEIFIGPAAVAPYETPGTQAFAETVLPFVEDHNTILLTNHGIVCWADTVTHAEWLTEIFETCCKTYLLAQQIGRSLKVIPEEKINEILALKQRMGLPDARLTRSAETAGAAPEVSAAELERMVERVVARLEERE
ncbi:MAG: class II aldolase/adducin family protein [Terracidiphilus sp.]|jgi:L-fuculose-phosphate aldolase